MSATKISISRALVLLKHYLKGFPETIKKPMADVYVNGKSFFTGETIEDTKKVHNANFQSILDTIESAHKKRVAINKSNHETIIQIDGKEMSIADALSYRANAIPLLKDLLVQLTGQDNIAKAEFKKLVDNFNTRYQKSDNTVVEAVKVVEFPELNAPTVFIEQVRATIFAFESELDAILTEKNAVTLIDG